MYAYIIIADGFEEIEAIAVIDILRRAGINIKIISITGSNLIKGAHDFTIACDEFYENIDFKEGEMIVLPGGMPGTKNLLKHEGLGNILKEYSENGKWIAAICAAPIVLGKYGILDGKNATCYPGFEKDLGRAKYVNEEVVVDGKVVTSKGPGTALEFGIKLVELTLGKDIAKKVREAMLI
jgi:4-methyl-5(b-hydroxyethyl)-thiazole monophosphate biosynthesis